MSNAPHQPGSSSGSHEDAASDPRYAAQSPPPPPPGYQPHYPPPSQPEKRGVFWIISKTMGALFIAAALVALGYYGALFAILGDGASVTRTVYQPGEGTQQVAIIPIEGPITADTADFVRNAVRSILDDDNIRGVVLQVDSPGGGVGPSERIHHHLGKLKTERNLPVVASYGSMAASGGVYVSAGADHIYAMPNCITASIGVVGTVPNLEGMMKKIGVDVKVIEAESSPDKDLGNNVFREWTDRDVNHLQGMLTTMHDRFVNLVREGRGERLNPELESETFSGVAVLADRAVEMGLVDEVGFIDDAIGKAVDMGAFDQDSPPVVRLSPRRGLLEAVGMGSAALDRDATVRLDVNPQRLREALSTLHVPRLQYVYQP